MNNISLSSHTVSDTSYRTNVLIQLRSPRTVLMINAPQTPYYAKRYNCCIIYIMLNSIFLNFSHQFTIPLLVRCLILLRRLHKYLQQTFTLHVIISQSASCTLSHRLQSVVSRCRFLMSTPQVCIHLDFRAALFVALVHVCPGF